MNRRLAVLVLALIALAMLAVPALGRQKQIEPRLNSQSAVRALAKARLALLTARSAQSLARNAFNNSKSAKDAAIEAEAVAKAAKDAAAGAQAGAAATKATLESTKIQSAFAPDSVTTESETYVQLAGGPSVTVTVPSSGLIEAWAQVRFAGEGVVALFEDGQKLPGQAENCGPEEEGSALLSSQFFEPITLATPSTPPFASPFCGVEGAPSGVLFQTTPGTHTYELRYEIGCGCEPTATFSKRLLRVAARL